MHQKTRRGRAAIALALSAASLFAGVANAQSFVKSALNGATLDAPTALQFGPDDRLYVTERYGLIRIYTVSRAGSSSYAVTDTETISLVQNIVNYNDDGNVNGSQSTRQTTGMFVAGSPANPVIYVTSSDPRTAVGNDSGLDTNSGILSRLTWDGASWVKLDLVRGLPRNEENHSTNGLWLDASTNTMYIAQGGHTNMGAPSNNFAFQKEYALSAAILSVDLTAIGETTYDLPTLNDPARADEQRLFNGVVQTVDVNDPFGGNNGDNQAVIVPGGPVQVLAPGFRNAYDVCLTAGGRMYTIDNGPNSNWGGTPVGCSFTSNETDSRSYDDALHFIGNMNDYVAGSYYGGHPNTTRADRSNTFAGGQSPIPVGFENSVECVYQRPFGEGNPPPAPHDQLDGSLWSWNSSTNGLCEYTASNFAGAMQGNLLAATYNGQSIERIQLGGAGDTIVSVSSLFSNVGGSQLDVTAQGDLEVFPGTVWSAGFAQDSIYVFEPDDFSVCTGLYDTALDEDADGFSNADEIDNGTDPCSNGSVPPDNDNDGLSDLNDTDDDNDGLLDEIDPFAIDGFNGLTTAMPVAYEWGVGEPGFGLLGLGFTGLLTNGVDNYRDQFTPEEMTPGGAAGIFTIDVIDAGDAFQSENSQRNGFQFGVNVTAATGVFEVSTSIEPPFFDGLNPEDFQSIGLHIGAGDQDNLVKLVMTANGGAGGVQLQSESSGTALSHSFGDADYGGAILSAGSVGLVLTIDPLAGTVQASVSLAEGPRVQVGTPVVLAGEVLARVQGPDALAVGLISTSFGTAGAGFTGSWDYLRVTPVASTASAVVRIDPGGDGIDNSTYGNGSFQITNSSTGMQLITDVSIDLGTAVFPDMVFDPDGTAGDATAKGFTINKSGGTSVSGHAFESPNNGVDGDDGYGVLRVTFGDFEPNETMNFSIDNDPTSIKGGSAPGPNEAGSVSGAELTGSTVTVTFSDGTVLTRETVYDGATVDASEAVVANTPQPAPFLQAVGIGTGSSEVVSATQVIRVTGPAGATGELMHASGGLYLGGQTGAYPNGYDLDPFETNSLSAISAIPFTIGADGIVDVPVTLTRFVGDGGYTPSSNDQLGHNTFAAAIDDDSGLPGLVSEPVLLQLIDADLAASTLAIQFGNAIVGDVSTRSLSLTNTSGAAIDVTSLNITGNPPFGIDSPPSLPATIPAGGTLDLTVRFAPESPGSELGLIAVEHTGNNSPQVVTLDGTGVFSAGDILFRINTGGPLVAAVDSGPNWAADTPATPSAYLVAGGDNASGFAVVPGGSVPPTTPAGVFTTERWDPGAVPEMQWEFPVGADAMVEVRLYLGNGYGGTSAPGGRVFGVVIEGADPFGDLDLSVSPGHEVGGMFATTVDVGGDGVLDIDFVHIVENPLVNAIEILAVASPAPELAPDAGVLAFGAWQTGGRSPESQVAITNTGNAPATISGITIDGADTADFEVTSGPSIPTLLNPGESTQIGVKFAPQSNGPKAAELRVVAAELFDPLVISLSGEGTPAGPGFVLLRVNAGGPAVAAADGSTPDWAADTQENPSQYSNQAAITNSTYMTEDGVVIDSSVAPSAPEAVFQSERYVNVTAAPGASLEWEFPVPVGLEVEVRLYFAEIFFDSASNGVQGPRVFDVLVEGNLLADDLDQFAQFGHDIGFMLSTTLVSDGVVDIVLAAAVQNPAIKAIEILTQSSPVELLVRDELVAIVANAGAPLKTETNAVIASDGSAQNVGLSAVDDTTGVAPTWLTLPTTVTTGNVFDLDVDASAVATGFYSATVTATTSGSDPVFFAVELVVNGGVNAAPVANDDALVALGGVPADLDVLFNDTDDGFPASPLLTTVQVVSQPTRGTAIVNPDGTILYTYTGPLLVVEYDDSLSYTLTDRGGLTSLAATVTVSVSPYVSNASADLTVNNGQPISAATSSYTANSFQLTNSSAGGQAIEFFELDLSTAAMIDLIFDPDGKAGDSVGKALDVDSDPGVGAITPQFLDFNNGVDDDDGFDRLRVEFADFGPGKTLGFSTDIDPNSIKGYQGSGLAGSVMGLELVGANVTVGFSDGRVRTGRLYGSGLSGGASVRLVEDEPPTPTLELVGGGGLDQINVSQNNHVFRVFAPEGTTVRLLRFEAVLSPQGINGGLGYEVELFEANTLPGVALTSQQTGVTGPGGYAEFSEFILSSPVAVGEEPGFNHLVAVADDGSQFGDTSNAMIVKIGYNLPPFAADDVLELAAGATAAVDAVSNDVDLDGFVDAATVTVVTPPASGSIAGIDPVSGQISYTAPAIGVTSDSFTYTVFDNAGAISNTATVQVNIQCRADLNGDGVLDNGDIGVFVQLFLAGEPAADMNTDGVLDNGDIGAFVEAFLAGC